MKFTPNDGFPYYLGFVKDMECLKLFSSQSGFKFLNSIPEEKADYRYAPGKWSIKHVVGHITDHERIKMFRAFLMSREEAVQLWGYEQNRLVDNSRFEELPLHQLIQDLVNVRKGSISFIETLSSNQLKIKGWANEYEVTLEEYLKTIIGHGMHHLKILKERYL